MLEFVTFAVKTQLNVHDLNNETVAGNVMDIRIIEFIDEDGNRQEAPAVSGRMLKHWHYEAMRRLILLNGPYSSLSSSLCDGCKSGEPIRPGKTEDSKIVQASPDESEAISSCALCDIHGYLIAQEAQKGAKKQKGKKEKQGKEKTIQEREGETQENAESSTKSKESQDKAPGISARRSSRAMFSWLMPVPGKETVKQVLHTRVSQQQSMSGGEDKAQMIFSKSYASGIYAFVSALDVARIGLVESCLGETDPYAIDDNGRKVRIKAAIEAYRLLISGQMGASLSHALPHMKPIEILVGYSEKRPLPFLVSPMYADYLSKTVGLMPAETQLLYWGDESPSGVSKKAQINEIFEELCQKVG